MNSIRSLDGNMDWDDVEEKLMGTSAQKSGSGGRRGHKTIKALAEQSVENAQEKRKKEAKEQIIKDLEHFPFLKFSKEQLPEVISLYSDWVGRKVKQPKGNLIIENFDKEVEYDEVRGSGPGGQNKNKTSTGVSCRHILTGFYERVDGNRERLINLREANAKLEERLESHVENWRVYLYDVSVEKKSSTVRELVQELAVERVK